LRIKIFTITGINPVEECFGHRAMVTRHEVRRFDDHTQLVKLALLSSQNDHQKNQGSDFGCLGGNSLLKNKILELYLNQVPYGGTAWGVESAAERYFGKKVKDLDLAECSLLAGLPQAPSLYSPFGAIRNMQRTTKRGINAYG